jgi:hypothetical protein
MDSYQEEDNEILVVHPYISTRKHKQAEYQIKGNLNWLSKNDPVMEFAERFVSILTYNGKWYIREDVKIESPELVSCAELLSDLSSDSEDDQLMACYIILKNCPDVSTYLSRPLCTMAWEKWLSCRDRNGLDVTSPEEDTLVQPVVVTQVVVPSYRASVAVALTGGSLESPMGKETVIFCPSPRQLGRVRQIPGARPLQRPVALNQFAPIVKGGRCQFGCFIRRTIDKLSPNPPRCSCLDGFPVSLLGNRSSPSIRSFSALSRLSRRRLIYEPILVDNGEFLLDDFSGSFFDLIFYLCQREGLEDVVLSSCSFHKELTSVSILFKADHVFSLISSPSLFERLMPQWYAVECPDGLYCVAVSLRFPGYAYPFYFIDLSRSGIRKDFPKFAEYLVSPDLPRFISSSIGSVRIVDPDVKFVGYLNVADVTHALPKISLGEVEPLSDSALSDWFKTHGPQDPDFENILCNSCTISAGYPSGRQEFRVLFKVSKVEHVFVGSDAPYLSMRCCLEWFYKLSTKIEGYVTWVPKVRVSSPPPSSSSSSSFVPPPSGGKSHSGEMTVHVMTEAEKESMLKLVFNHKTESKLYASNTAILKSCLSAYSLRIETQPRSCNGPHIRCKCQLRVDGRRESFIASGVTFHAKYMFTMGRIYQKFTGKPLLW